MARRRFHRVLATAILILALPATGLADTVLSRVKRQGVVRCGIDNTPGFSGVGPSGRPSGFDVDFCRAVAAATLGDPEAIALVRVSTANKFEALTRGEIDLALGMTTWTYSRETARQCRFPAVVLHDGQGFMAWADSGIRALDPETPARVCVQTGTTSEKNLQAYNLRRKTPLVLAPAATSEEKFSSFIQRKCELVTGDLIELETQRRSKPIDPSAWIVLPDAISSEPLGVAVAAGDQNWESVVRWVVLATLAAERLGVSSDNIGRAGEPTDPELRNLLGLEPGLGRPLGLDDDFARRIIAAVGNYAEIYDRNLGAGSPLHLPRGKNALTRDGGWLFAPPLR